MTKIILDNYNGCTYYYNTNSMRIVEYYLNLDLYKIKHLICQL